jgi:hypothetical protein
MFHNGEETIEYWIMFYFKIHLNLKSHGNLGVFLVFLENAQWIRFYEGDLEMFRPKVWEILNFEYFLTLKIQ